MCDEIVEKIAESCKTRPGPAAIDHEVSIEVQKYIHDISSTKYSPTVNEGDITEDADADQDQPVINKPTFNAIAIINCSDEDDDSDFEPSYYKEDEDDEEYETPWDVAVEACRPYFKFYDTQYMSHCKKFMNPREMREMAAEEWYAEDAHQFPLLPIYTLQDAFVKLDMRSTISIYNKVMREPVGPVEVGTTERKSPNGFDALYGFFDDRTPRIIRK